VAAYRESVDGQAFVPLGMTTSRQLSLPDGGHNVLVAATDAAGNTAIGAISFRTDTNPISLTGPYFGLPIYLFLITVVGTAVGVRRRRRRRRARLLTRRLR